MKRMILMSVCLLLVGCLGSTGGKVPDRSGTYVSTKIQCQDDPARKFQTLNSSVGTYERSVTISGPGEGASFSQTIVTPACSATYTGSIRYNGVSAEISELTVSGVTGGSCTQSFDVPEFTCEESDGECVYTISHTVSDGQVLPSKDGALFISTDASLGMNLEKPKNSEVDPNEVCAEVFEKQ